MRWVLILFCSIKLSQLSSQLVLLSLEFFKSAACFLHFCAWLHSLAFIVVINYLLKASFSFSGRLYNFLLLLNLLLSSVLVRDLLIWILLFSSKRFNYLVTLKIVFNSFEACPVVSHLIRFLLRQLLSGMELDLRMIGLSILALYRTASLAWSIWHWCPSWGIAADSFSITISFSMSPRVLWTLAIFSLNLFE